MADASFGSIEIGTIFSFANLVDKESWEKIRPNQARRVNSSEVRNVGSDEPVNVLRGPRTGAEADPTYPTEPWKPWRPK